jgi:homoserine O-acetyltransferase
MALTDRCKITETTAVRSELRHILPLRHGGVADLNFRYELVGPPGAPLLIVAGGISAGRHVISSTEHAEAGWWQVQSEPFSGYRLLAIDWIGADGTIDLPIDPADQADAIAWLLEELGEPRAAAFIGASYGAMVGMHLAARHPDHIGALLAISAADKSHPYSSACRSLQRKAIDLGSAVGDPAAGVALARAMAMLTYRTPEEFAERFAHQPEVHGDRVRVAAEPYLEAHGERHCQRMSAIAYRRLSESIDLHHIDPKIIRCPLTLVAVDNDALVPSEDIETLAAQVRGSAFHLIHSRFGHDAFLKEERQVAEIIANFLDALEPNQ